MKKARAFLVLILILIFIGLISTDIFGWLGAEWTNKQTFDFSYKYTNAYVKVGEDWTDMEIKSWSNCYPSGQVKLVLNDGTILFVNSENCILYNGSLPETK